LWRGFTFPWKLFARIIPFSGNMYSRFVSENVPLYALDGPDRHFVFSVSFLAVVLAISFMLNRKRAKTAHILLCGGFALLAVLAQRNILLFFFVAAPVLAYNLSCLDIWNDFSSMKQRRRTALTWVWVVTVASLLAVPVSSHARIIALYPSGSAISPFRIPVAAADYLEVHRVPGNMFNSVRYGGYLAWRFYPEKKVYIDGRLTVRTVEFFNEYLAMLDNPQSFGKLAAKFNITRAVLPTAVFYRYMGLVKWLYESPEWKLVFTDGASAVFVRSDLHPVAGIDLGSRDGIIQVYGEIEKQWKNDRYIYLEARAYLDNLIRYLYGEKR
jgi:hypothetical protein